MRKWPAIRNAAGQHHQQNMVRARQHRRLEGQHPGASGRHENHQHGEGHHQRRNVLRNLARDQVADGSRDGRDEAQHREGRCGRRSGLGHQKCPGNADQHEEHPDRSHPLTPDQPRAQQHHQRTGLGDGGDIRDRHVDDGEGEAEIGPHLEQPARDEPRVEHPVEVIGLPHRHQHHEADGNRRIAAHEDQLEHRRILKGELHAAVAGDEDTHGNHHGGDGTQMRWNDHELLK